MPSLAWSLATLTMPLTFVMVLVNHVMPRRRGDGRCFKSEVMGMLALRAGVVLLANVLALAPVGQARHALAVALGARCTTVVLDTRTADSYQQGHAPCAYSYPKPLFDSDLAGTLASLSSDVGGDLSTRLLVLQRYPHLPRCARSLFRSLQATTSVLRLHHHNYFPIPVLARCTQPNTPAHTHTHTHTYTLTQPTRSPTSAITYASVLNKMLTRRRRVCALASFCSCCRRCIVTEATGRGRSRPTSRQPGPCRARQSPAATAPPAAPRMQGPGREGGRDRRGRGRRAGRETTESAGTGPLSCLAAAPATARQRRATADTLACTHGLHGCCRCGTACCCCCCCEPPAGTRVSPTRAGACSRLFFLFLPPHARRPPHHAVMRSGALGQGWRGQHGNDSLAPSLPEPPGALCVAWFATRATGAARTLAA